MRILAALLILFLFLSCNSRSSQKINENSDSKINTTEEIKEDEEIELSILVDVLNKFYQSDDHYLGLYFNEEIEESDYQILSQKHGRIIAEVDEYYTRYELTKETAKQYFLIDNLNELYVLDINQNIVDSIKLNHFEFLDEEIETSYVASYNSTKNYSDFLVISKSSVINSFKKSPVAISDNGKQIVNVIDIDPNDIYSADLFSIDESNEALSIFSYSDRKDYTHHILLIKNELITDSIDGYSVDKLTPVPLSKDEKYYYVAHCYIPDTDANWNQFIGIDKKTGKFLLTKGNRYVIND
ncbi:MAG: hypothetical protein RLQ12_07795 [Cyclobacteriaceae bacterium]